MTFGQPSIHCRVLRLQSQRVSPDPRSVFLLHSPIGEDRRAKSIDLCEPSRENHRSALDVKAPLVYELALVGRGIWKVLDTEERVDWIDHNFCLVNDRRPMSVSSLKAFLNHWQTALFELLSAATSAGIIPACS